MHQIMIVRYLIARLRREGLAHVRGTRIHALLE
jgi:hypothetical protein